MHGNKDTLPSDVERALYAIGFLAKNTSNLVDLIKNWETKGICKAADEPNYGTLFKTAVLPITLQIQKAYEVWETKQSAEKEQATQERS